jgi:hypothetical protein
MAPNIVNPLNQLVPIVDSFGRPTLEFMLKWAQQARQNSEGGSSIVGPGDATKFLNGEVTPVFAQVKDSDLAMSDTVANNVSTSKHGFAPKAPNDATQFLDGTGAYDTVKDTDLSTSDNTTNNVSTSKHGFAPKAPNDATQFLDGTGAYDTVKDTDLSTSDNTANNVSTSKHGFAPKAPNDATMFLDGTGNYSKPAAKQYASVQPLGTNTNTRKFATQGVIIRPLSDIKVTQLTAVLNVNSSSPTYKFSIVSLNYTPGSALFAVVSSDNIATAMSSTNGTSYTDRSIPGNTRYSAVAYCDSLGKFIAVCSGGTVTQWAYSGDAINWTAIASPPFTNAQNVAWSKDLNIAVAWSSSATNGMAWSTDLTTWTVVSNAGCISSISSPGGHAICWSPELGIFCAAGQATGTNQYATSPDGKTWTGNTTGTLVNLCGIAWGGDGHGGGAQRFIAVGTGNVVRTSTNGTSWTSETFATTPGTVAVDIAYSPLLDRFVVVGNNGTCQTREGGSATWTQRTISNHTWRSIVWSAGVRLFVVVADDGSVATSPDGITWTDRTASSVHAWRSIAVADIDTTFTINSQLAVSAANVTATGSQLVDNITDNLTATLSAGNYYALLVTGTSLATGTTNLPIRQGPSSPNTAYANLPLEPMNWSTVETCALNALLPQNTPPTSGTFIIENEPAAHKCIGLFYTLL